MRSLALFIGFLFMTSNSRRVYAFLTSFDSSLDRQHRDDLSYDLYINEKQDEASPFAISERDDIDPLFILDGDDSGSFPIFSGDDIGLSGDDIGLNGDNMGLSGDDIGLSGDDMGLLADEDMFFQDGSSSENSNALGVLNANPSEEIAHGFSCGQSLSKRDEDFGDSLILGKFFFFLVLML